MNPWDDEWQDYCEILGVRVGDSARAIKRAYRRQAVLWHPDRHPESDKAEASRRFLLVREAYSVLSDPATSAAYFAEVERRRGLGLPEKDLGPCAVPGCGRQAGGTCAACGKPACAFHLVPESQTGGRFNLPGLYCHACLPTCCECGALAVAPVPVDLTAAEAAMRARNPQGIWCPECLRSAPIFACSGCGSDGHHLAELRKCAHCGKSGLCPHCMRTIEGVNEDPCTVCARVAFWRGVRVVLHKITVNAGTEALALVLVFSAGIVLYADGCFLHSALRDQAGLDVAVVGAFLIPLMLSGLLYPVGWVARAVLEGVIEVSSGIAESVGGRLTGIAEAKIRARGYRRA